MKMLFTILASLTLLSTANATLYTGSLSPNPAIGYAGSTVTINFTLTTGPAIPGLTIYTSILGVITALPTSDNPVFGIYGQNFSATFTVPSLPNGTPIFFTLSTAPFGTIYGNSGPFPTFTVLPIIFQNNSIKYTPVSDKATLSWTIGGTAADALRFDIMRSSNGKNYIKVGSVNANSTNNNYNYDDLIAPTDATTTYYYKIVGVSKDGVAKETNVMLIKQGVKEKIPVILNNVAVKNNITLVGVNLSDYKAAEIKVVDVLGRTYYPAILNNNTLLINNLSSGMYYLKIKDLPVVKFIEN